MALAGLPASALAQHPIINGLHDAVAKLLLLGVAKAPNTGSVDDISGIAAAIAEYLNLARGRCD